jgi:predicted ester cyclase
MNENQNEKAYRTVVGEAYNKGNLAVLDQVIAPGFVEHQAGIVPPSLEGLKSSIMHLRSAFPDLNVTVDDILTNGDKTWARLTARGTQKGPFAGLAPTGKPFAITVFDECRFQNGRIVEHWGVADQMALMMQIRAGTTASVEEVSMAAGAPAPTPPVNWI